MTMVCFDQGMKNSETLPSIGTRQAHIRPMQTEDRPFVPYFGFFVLPIYRTAQIRYLQQMEFVVVIADYTVVQAVSVNHIAAHIAVSAGAGSFETRLGSQWVVHCMPVLHLLFFDIHFELGLVSRWTLAWLARHLGLGMRHFDTVDIVVAGVPTCIGMEAVAAAATHRFSTMRTWYQRKQELTCIPPAADDKAANKSDIEGVAEDCHKTAWQVRICLSTLDGYDQLPGITC